MFNFVFDVDMTDLYEKLEKLREEYSDDQILAEFGSSILASYVKRNGSPYSVSDCIMDNDDAIKVLKGVVRFIHPNGYLTKDDMKKELCEFIDFWCN